MLPAHPHHLILPGWQGSPDLHWQSHWQRCLPGARRVEQRNWLTPRRVDWVETLDRALDAAPVVVVAHSLGCATLAHWAAQASPERLGRVLGALLVAPADVERPDCPAALRDFAPLPRQRLPFPSLLVASDNDPAASVPRALAMAGDWGAEAVVLPGAGHINVKSGHCRWEEGFAWLYRLHERVDQPRRRRA